MRVILFHSLSHARAALGAAAEAGVPLTLQSAPGVAAYAGAGYLKAVVERAAAAHPGASFSAVIDCGADPGVALAALRGGWKTVGFSGAAKARAKLADIAGQTGARVLEGAAPSQSLDLLDVADARSVCRAFLAGGKS